MLVESIIYRDMGPFTPHVGCYRFFFLHSQYYESPGLWHLLGDWRAAGVQCSWSN